MSWGIKIVGNKKITWGTKKYAGDSLGEVVKANYREFV